MTEQTADAKPASRTAGSQTLARGLEILKAVVSARDGLTPAEVAERLGIHRTIAYRVLNTLADARMVHRGDDGRYRGSTGLLALASAAHQGLRAAALPVLRETAEELGATVALLVKEGDEAVALAVVSPTSGTYHVAFSQGGRHPLGKGAAGHAILASAAPRPGEAEAVARARKDGYACTYGEVEPGMYGLAVPLAEDVAGIPACLNIITMQQDRAMAAVDPLQAAADRISARLA